MQVIRPTQVTDSILLSSTIAEDEYSAWSSGTTYALGDYSIKNHRIWKSVQATNLNHDPETNISWWADQGPTLRWAMFDEGVSTLSINPLEITVELEPGRIDSLALFNLDAAEVQVEMVAGVDTVFSETYNMISTEGVIDLYTYFFEPIVALDTLIVTSLPVFGEGVLTVTMTKSTGDVQCGVLVVGQKAHIGKMQYRPRISINDYSKKTIDSFGNTTLIKKSFSKKLSTTLEIENTSVDRVYKQLQELRSTPVVWVSDTQYTSMSVYGYYANFDIEIPYPSVSFCTLSIEGLI